MVFVVLHIKAILTHSLAAHRHARLMHRVGAAGDQIVPPVEVRTLVDQPVGAGRRQPGDLAHHLGRQPDAVRHNLLPVFVIRAAAALAIKQRTADIGPDDFAGIPVLELVEAAPPAAVAKAFPLAARHLVEGLLLPERHCVHQNLRIWREPRPSHASYLFLRQKYAKSGDTPDRKGQQVRAGWTAGPLGAETGA